ncbi:MAG: alpha/beta fold hydrolase [Haloarculaceae archaeon]
MGSTIEGIESGSVDFETAQSELFDEAGLDARSQFFELDTQVRVHAFETGSADDDLPRIFVHGTGGFGAFFSPLIAQFDAARSIAFDRPGYGLSDPFVYTETNLRRTVVDVIEDVFDELEIERADLVGHSMGGHASILFAVEHPDRVRRIATVGAIPGFPGTRPPVPLRLLTVPILNRVLRRLQKSGEEGVLDIAEIFGERDAIQDYPALVRALAAHEYIPKAAEAGRSEFDALFSLRGWHSSARMSEAELQNLQHPTTVIWGDHDPLGGSDDVRESVKSIPDVRFETVDSGHIPFLTHPEQCARLIRK